MGRLLWMLLLLHGLYGLVHSQGPANFEKKLRDDLFAKYDNKHRPVQNHSKTTTVDFGLALISFNFNEKNGALQTMSWARLRWQDEYLKWNTEDYGGVEHIKVPSDDVWTPDVMLYNSAESHLYPHRTHALVYSDGDVLWVPPLETRSYCDIDLSNWPWDVQRCTLKFGSWTHDGFQLDMKFYGSDEKVDLSDVNDRHPWKVISSTAIRTVKYYPCCDEPYIDLTFNLTFARQSTVDEKLIFVPSTLVICLTLAMFCCVVHIGAKILVGLVNLLVMNSMLHFFRSNLSYIGASVPLVFVYHTAVMVLVVLGILLSFVEDHLGTLDYPPPATLDRLLDGWLGSLLLLRCCNRQKRGRTIESQALKNQEGDDVPLEKEPNPPKRDWSLVVLAMNRIALVIYIIIIFILYARYGAAAASQPQPQRPSSNSSSIP